MQTKKGPNSDSNLEFFTQAHIESLGYQFISRDKSLPGRPDLVIPGHRVAIMVNGCFYHFHGAGCSDSHIPVTNRSYWQGKFAHVKARDERNQKQLLALGYRVLTLWGCGLRRCAPDQVRTALSRFIEGALPEQELGHFELIQLMFRQAEKRK